MPHPIDTATLARLAFWIPPGRLEEFGAVYADHVQPLLQRRNLTAADIQPPCIKEGIFSHTVTVGDYVGNEVLDRESVFSRAFACTSPTAVATQAKALRQDPDWIRTLRQLGERFGVNPHDGLIRHRFALWQTTAGAGHSVEAGPGMRHRLWHSFSIQDGLPGSTVCAVFEDSRGRIWFGTLEGGVCLFDGAQFTVFTTDDGLSCNHVTFIFEDTQNRLWFATADGVSCYDGLTFVNVGCEDGMINPHVWAIAQDPQGRLWFGTNQGISYKDKETYKPFIPPDSANPDLITSIVVDREGACWFGRISHLGVGRYLDGVWQGFPEFSHSTAKNDMGYVAVDRRGLPWFLFKKGTICFNGQNTTDLDTRDGLASDRVTFLVEDQQGYLWFGTPSNGVGYWNGTGWTTFNVQDGLADDQVVCGIQDSRGHLWFGTLGGGVSRYNPHQLEIFTTADGLASNGVMRLHEDRNGRIWCGTWNGVSHYNGSSFASIEALTGRNIYALAEDREGRLWFGESIPATGDEGVYCFDGTTCTRMAPGGDKPFEWRLENIQVGLADRQEHLWFGTRMGKIHRFDGSHWQAFATDQPLSNPLTGDGVLALLEDRHGQIWCGLGGLGANGTEAGVWRFNGTEFECINNQLAGGTVWSMREDRQGRIWCGTLGGGVYCYNGEDWCLFTTADGLASNRVHAILEDSRGHLWFGTFGGGVSRFDGQVFQTLAKRDGLAHDTVQALLEDRQGRIWIATQGGITRYRPQTHPLTVRLTDIVADQRYGPQAEVQLALNNELLAFEFQGCSFVTPPDRMAYIYRLQGHDTTWRITYDRRVEYQNLPLGHYTFQIKAIDRDLNYSALTQVRLDVVPDPFVEALSQNINGTGQPAEFVGTSHALQDFKRQVAQVAPTDLSVLIQGETGTGKGLAARLVHGLSRRQGQPFIHVNCGAIPENLVESELFGHEKGAFTGAVARRIGKCELADGGTLFLDEVGELPLEAQVKLLRFLEEHLFERLGSERTLQVDVRLVAATNRDLQTAIQTGAFREDLFYRLNMFALKLPPLRDRVEDIPMLVHYFVQRFARHLNRPQPQVQPAALTRLEHYAWPGNVRELEHLVQRAVLVCRNDRIEVEDLALEAVPDAVPQPPQGIQPFSEYQQWLAAQEKQYLEQVLEKTNGLIYGDKGAAQLLQVRPEKLRARMRKYGLRGSS